MNRPPTWRRCPDPRCTLDGPLHDYEHRDAAGRSWARHDAYSPARGYKAPVALIKTLRDRTGHSLDLCKAALERFGGDIDTAEESIPTKRAAAC